MTDITDADREAAKSISLELCVWLNSQGMKAEYVNGGDDRLTLAFAARHREASTAELRERLIASTESMERTLAAMDRYNEQNGTAIIGPSLLTLGKMIAANRKALGGQHEA